MIRSACSDSARANTSPTHTIAGPPEDRLASAGKSAEKRNRAVVFDGLKVDAEVFDGAELTPPIKIHGPAIVEEPTTTVVIPPQWELSVNRFGDYELSLV